MTIATLTNNGMINLPAEIRKKFNLLPGDKLKFIEIGEEIRIVPIKKISELVDSGNKDKAVEMIKELTKEHKIEAEQDR